MGTHDDTDTAGLDRDLNRRIVRGSAWVGLGFGLGQLLTFASMLVLARLLSPSSFGIVAAGIALLAVVSQIQESGLGAAVVQQRHRDPHVAAASALVFASLAGFALTALVVVVAPVYTSLLRLPEATPYIQALAAVLAIRGLAVIPGALLERELDFRSRTKAELTGYFTQAVVSVSCALGGLETWSLVAGVIAGTGTQGLLMWVFAPFRPTPRDASGSMLREMLHYGRFVSGANVFVIVNNSIDNVVVARFLGAGPLGAYSVAWRLAGLPSTVIGVVVGRVMFSVYSRLQHDLAATRAAYLQNLQRVMLFALPVTVALGIGAEPIVLGLLGPNWDEVIEPLRILALFGLIRLFISPSGELFKGIGRPQLAFVSTVIHFCVALPALLVLVPRFGTAGAAFALVLAVAAAGAFVVPLTLSAIELRPAVLIRELANPAACAAVVALALGIVVPLTAGLSPIGSLVVIAVIGTGSYLVAVALFARSVVTPIVAGLRRA